MLQQDYWNAVTLSEYLTSDTNAKLQQDYCNFVLITKYFTTISHILRSMIPQSFQNNIIIVGFITSIKCKMNLHQGSSSIEAELGAYYWY